LQLFNFIDGNKDKERQMNKAALGKLEKVDLRAIWETEDGDFTPWLAQEQNITLLGETIGIDLEVEAQEKEVGPFRADILCKDTVTDHWVLIENQIERTDHSHLGQLLTYAAGLNAVSIVWIAEKFTEEHRATLDWLNEITESQFNFFGLEIELWRIGESPVAPKFNIISQPNDWGRTVKEVTARIESENLTEGRKLQLEYWTVFRDYVLANSSILKPQKPLPQNWTNFAIGRSHFHLVAVVNISDKKLTAYLCLSGPNAKPHYYLLLKNKEEIEKEMGFPIEWRELPENKESHLTVRKDADPNDRSSWAIQHQWLKESLEQFHKVLSSRIKTLNADDYKA
jgi:hypothetical protein